MLSSILPGGPSVAVRPRLPSLLPAQRGKLASTGHQLSLWTQHRPHQPAQRNWVWDKDPSLFRRISGQGQQNTTGSNSRGRYSVWWQMSVPKKHSKKTSLNNLGKVFLDIARPWKLLFISLCDTTWISVMLSHWRVNFISLAIWVHFLLISIFIKFSLHTRLYSLRFTAALYWLMQTLD